MKKLGGAKLKKFNKKNTTQKELTIVLDNIEYARNVASVFNLAFALKVENIYLSGITPTPPFGKDLKKVSRNHEEQIHWKRLRDSKKFIMKLREQHFTIIMLAKTDQSITFSKLNNSHLLSKVAIIIGNEKQGLANNLFTLADYVVHVPVYRPLAHLNIVNELAVVAYTLI